ncbi:hypothetical protein ACFL6Y_04045 [Elusimicrobiota bacterium]
MAVSCVPHKAVKQKRIPNVWSVEIFDDGKDIDAAKVDSASLSMRSNCAFDKAGGFHIVYIIRSVLRYAVYADDKWALEDIPVSLSAKDSFLKFALDADDAPHVLYRSLHGLQYVHRTGNGWKVGLITDEIDKHARWSLEVSVSGEVFILLEDRVGRLVVWNKESDGTWEKDSLEAVGEIPVEKALCLNYKIDNRGDKSVIFSRKGRLWEWEIESSNTRKKLFFNVNDAQIEACRLVYDNINQAHILLGAWNHDASGKFYELYYSGRARSKSRFSLLTKSANIDHYDLDASIALDVDQFGKPHIIYYDKASEKLSYVHYQDSAWFTSSVYSKSTMEETGNMPVRCSMALSPNGNPWILYNDSYGIMKLARLQ